MDDKASTYDVRGLAEMLGGVAEAALVTMRGAAQALASSASDLSDRTTTVAGSMQGVADGLIENSKLGGELLGGFIRAEIDKTVSRMGFVKEEELAAIKARLAVLESGVTDSPDPTVKTSAQEQRIPDGFQS